MFGKSKVPDGGGSPRVEVKSCRIDDSGYPEAIDILTIWILQDINAVAKSFGLELTSILKDAFERVEREASDFARDMQGSEG